MAIQPNEDPKYMDVRQKIKYFVNPMFEEEVGVCVCVFLLKKTEKFVSFSFSYLVARSDEGPTPISTHTHTTTFSKLQNVFVTFGKCSHYNFTYVTTTTPLVCCLSLPLFQSMCVMANLKAEYLCNIP